jgi:PAS domain S-box-containing protein
MWLDHRAERGVDQVLRLAVAALRVPVALVALNGPDRTIQLLRMEESGAWDPIAGTALSRTLAGQVAGSIPAADCSGRSAVRGRLSVARLGIVEYAAIPLLVEQRLAGMFAVIDRRQREWGPEQEAMLRDFAGVVESEVEAHRSRAAALSTAGADHLVHALLELAGEGYVVLDSESRCIIWNSFMERLTSRSADEMMGMHASSLEELLRIPDFEMLLERAMRGESSTTDDQPYPTDAGHSDQRFVSVRASPLRSAEGLIVGVVLVLTDTTSAMTAERRRQRGEEMFRRPIEHSAELLTVIARDGTVLFDSLSNERIAGYAPDELLGRTIYELVHPDDVSRVATTLERLDAGDHATATVEYRFRHKSGSWRRLLSTCRNLSDDPLVHGIVLNSRDISDWRAMEEQLHEARRVDALGRLAGGVAHDFNNLLTAIKGNVQLLLMDTPPASPGREELEEIDQVSERAAQLTRRLLAFGRRSAPSPGSVDVAETVRGTTRMLQRLIGDVRLAVTCDEPAFVRTDATQLEQILVNLVLNARDAMPKGGTVSLDVRQAALPPDLVLTQPEAAGRRYVRLAVSDTGEGMDSATRRQIFEPFFTTKESGQGTGLGLATVYAIVMQNGGQIGVHSTPGSGTEFEIFLPAVDEGGDDTHDSASGA